MIYRTEHPKPQFQRSNWVNLNGPWRFEIDHGNSGEARGLSAPDAVFSQIIQVPFCPESKLSGVEYKDFMASVWYKRTVHLTAEQLSGRTVLHFGAVDYLATVFINGKKVGSHKGGYVSFAMDVTDYVVVGENTITVHAEDNTRDRMIPTGKQSGEYFSYGPAYTRTTGIWQTVWLEFTPKAYVKNVKYYPDSEACTLTVHADLVGSGEFSVFAAFDDKPMGKATIWTMGGSVTLNISLAEKHLWEVGKGGLYDLKLKFNDDEVISYFGLRSILLSDRKFYLNGKAVFQRSILDQGFYPDGIYTAPSDAELEADIDRAMCMGFNGARLHEKIFEERFLYHADRKGYLVWGEYPNWGLDHTYADAIYGILPEWLEEIDRDFNHPAIIGWCPFNETWDQNGRKQFDDLIALLYHTTKAADPTRPCIDASGNFHVVTDIYDLHDYEQDAQKFAEHYAPILRDEPPAFKHAYNDRQHYDARLPFFVSEYGGTLWSAEHGGWGYGEAPKTEKEFLTHLKALTDVLLDNKNIMGLCYTQLTDVEQEQNGLYTYDRKPKFDPALVYPIFARKAAIEG